MHFFATSLLSKNVGYTKDMNASRKFFQEQDFDVTTHENESNNRTMEILEKFQGSANEENVSKLVILVLSHGTQVMYTNM